MVSAINIKAECCLDPENRKKKHIILLGTLVISSNFLLDFTDYPYIIRRETI